MANWIDPKLDLIKRATDFALLDASGLLRHTIALTTLSPEFLDNLAKIYKCDENKLVREGIRKKASNAPMHNYFT
ncbi:hypothetical protein [Rouxiella badensis]|uniref:hypothetical protein n=1 Tax=Rouxiella badensis TaxID=1646377 RepID=UPI001D138AB0|nr:hypothetical protein [Rouxiella badensis]